MEAFKEELCSKVNVINTHRDTAVTYMLLQSKELTETLLNHPGKLPEAIVRWHIVTQPDVELMFPLQGTVETQCRNFLLKNQYLLFVGMYRKTVAFQDLKDWLEENIKETVKLCVFMEPFLTFRLKAFYDWDTEDLLDDRPVYSLDGWKVPTNMLEYFRWSPNLYRVVVSSKNTSETFSRLSGSNKFMNMDSMLIVKKKAIESLAKSILNGGLVEGRLVFSYKECDDTDNIYTLDVTLNCIGDHTVPIFQDVSSEEEEEMSSTVAVPSPPPPPPSPKRTRIDEELEMPAQGVILQITKMQGITKATKKGTGELCSIHDGHLSSIKLIGNVSDITKVYTEQK